MSEIAWAAGLFDGEGTIFASDQLRHKRAHVRLHAAIAMTDEETVRRFHAAVGVGYVHGPYRAKKKNWKPKWVWRGGRDKDIRTTLRLLWPWLGTAKRQQAERALARRDEYVANPVPKTDFKKSICIAGHDLTINRYVAPNGSSYCRLCQRERARRWRDRQAEVVTA